MIIKTRRLLKLYVHVKQFVVQLVPQIGLNATAERLGLSRKFVSYTYEKHRNPDHFHPGPIGGAQHTLMDETSRNVAEMLLWYEVKANPARRDTEFAIALQNAGIDLRVLPRAVAVERRVAQVPLLTGDG